MKRQIENPIFNHKTKDEIRKQIADTVIPGQTMFDLYGSGQNYRYCKERGVGIFSIDDGSDFKNAQNLKMELGPLELSSNGKLFSKDRAFIGLADLSQLVRNEFWTTWLDFCGPLGMHMWRDIPGICKIMTPVGYIFITYSCGHETFLQKGASRQMINEFGLLTTEAMLEANGIKLVKQVMNEHYISRPEYSDRKSNRGTPMVTVGYRYIKI